MKYRKLPIEIEAIQFTGMGNKSIIDVYNFLEGTNVTSERAIKDCGKNFKIDYCNGGCQVGDVIIKTLEGDMRARHGDYIIKGVNGEFYPCKPEIFEKTYEKVIDDVAVKELENASMKSDMEKITTLNPTKTMSRICNLVSVKDGEIFLHHTESKVNLCDYMREYRQDLKGLSNTELYEAMVGDEVDLPTDLVYFLASGFAVCRETLKRYEDTDLTPEEIQELKNKTLEE